MINIEIMGNGSLASLHNYLYIKAYVSSLYIFPGAINYDD